MVNTDLVVLDAANQFARSLWRNRYGGLTVTHTGKCNIFYIKQYHEYICSLPVYNENNKTSTGETRLRFIPTISEHFKIVLSTLHKINQF